MNFDSANLDVGHAGTAYRFLTAFLAISSRQKVLTGSERMKKRPIKTLVDALRTLGADIEYLGEEGYPPLKIQGKQLEGGRIDVDGGISSQFISALMLIAPTMRKGLDINLNGKIVSKPYIQMTAQLMQECGIAIELKSNMIRIPYGKYKLGKKTVEKDWSAASFWYQLALVGKIEQLHIAGLKEQSVQGDIHVKDIFLEHGVRSHFKDDGVELSYHAPNNKNKSFVHDFTDVPDLTQPYVVAMSIIGQKVEVNGIQHLKIKETNRIEALRAELSKIGVVIEITPNSIKVCSGIDEEDFRGEIQTYQDHRMAMAFATLAIPLREIEIENPEVVRKSYPLFWEQLKKLGFKLELEN